MKSKGKLSASEVLLHKPVAVQAPSRAHMIFVLAVDDLGKLRLYLALVAHPLSEWDAGICRQGRMPAIIGSASRSYNSLLHNIECRFGIISIGLSLKFEILARIIRSQTRL